MASNLFGVCQISLKSRNNLLKCLLCYGARAPDWIKMHFVNALGKKASEPPSTDAVGNLAYYSSPFSIGQSI